MDDQGMEDGSKEDQSKQKEQNSDAQSVISLLLKKHVECSSTLQTDSPVNCKDDGATAQCSSSSTSIKSVQVATTVSSPLDVAHIELPDGGVLLETSDVIQSALGGTTGTIHLETPAGFIQGFTVTDESDSCDATTKFIEGQAVRLEDGSTAFIHSIPRDGLQPVQLEDGTMAYLSQTREELFDGEATGLDLDQLPSSQMHVDGIDDKEIEVKMVCCSLREPHLLHTEENVAVANQQKSSQTRSGTGNEKAFPCPYENCDRVYTSPHHLKVHERSHTGDRPFKCMAPNCGKAFATGYGLKSHTRVHTGETPYKCIELSCGKAFKTSGDLQKHLRTHTGERPFKCPYAGCDRAFTTSNIRKVHVRTHTGEKPYICEMCGRAFASATNFKNHIRIHTGEKPYTCNVEGCFKKFTEYSSLYKHHVVHTRDKPYMCTLCGKHYRQTSTLAMHERNAHQRPAIINRSNVHGSKEKNICFKVEKAVGDDVPCFELVATELTAVPESVIEGAGSVQENSAITMVPKKLPTIIALQSSNNDSANPLLQEQTPVYTIQLQPDGSIGSSPQIFLVADPNHIAALQQISQVQFQNVNIVPLQTEVKTE